MNLEDFKAATPKLVQKIMQVVELSKWNDVVKRLVESGHIHYAIDYIKATTLFTGGHVQAVRDPDLFDPEKAKSWYVLVNKTAVAREISHVWPEEFVVPTKEDYQKANFLMNYMAKMPMPAAFHDRTTQRLFRGLAMIPPNVFLDLCEPGSEYNIGDIVSTSTVQSTAKYFANDGGRWKIVYSIDNSNFKGAPVQKASVYSHESEVVIGGRIKVTEFRYAPDLSDIRAIASLGQDSPHKSLIEPMERIENSKNIINFQQLVTFVQDVETVANYGVTKSYSKDYIQPGFTYVKVKLL